MGWILKEKEIQSVLLLEAPKRYSYFIKKIADQREVWSLFKIGWALASNEKGEEIISFWPHAEYAKLCATGVWIEFQPKSIDIESFMKKWIPGIVKDNRLIAVFPVPMEKGILIDPKRLEDDLKEELLKYE